jgi:hypothetical protein
MKSAKKTPKTTSPAGPAAMNPKIPAKIAMRRNATATVSMV